MRQSLWAVGHFRRIAFRSSLSIFALGGLPVAADENATQPLRRELGPHVFIPREAVSDPFTTTFVGTETGIAYGSAVGPTFNVNGKPVDLADYKIIGYSQIFTGQYGFFDWWALRFNATGVVYSGANGSAAAGVGLNAVARFGVGTTLSWQFAPTLRAGLLFDVGFGPSIGLNILQSIVQSIADKAVVTPVDSTGSTTLTPALSLAWTFARGFGLIVNVSYTHNTVKADAANTSLDSLGFGGGLDLDLRELGTIPLGLAVSYNAVYSIGDEKFRNYLLAGGLFYTGRQNLTLGLELAYRRAPIGGEGVFVKAIFGLIVLRYNFD